MSNFTKAPESRLDYAVDWTPFIQGTEGDAIASADWVDVTEGLVVEDPQLIGSVHAAFFSGGEPGRAYRATSRITTEQGRVDDRTITIYVRRT